MITFSRVGIFLASTLLTGCASCPLPGQPNPTAQDTFADKSTCDCYYLLEVVDPQKDVQSLDGQTTRVSAMLRPIDAEPPGKPRKEPRTTNTRYSFLVNKDEASLKKLAMEATDHELMFHGCRVSDIDLAKGEQFVLNAERSPWEKAVLERYKQSGTP